jgi:hypothetical protein
MQSLDFVEQKNSLLNKLNEHTSKLLFPKVMIYCINKCGLQILANYFKNYNYYLLKIRNYELKLLKLQKWSFLSNIYSIWNYKIISKITQIDLATKELLNYILEKSKFNEFQNLFEKFNIKYKSILMFMNINKGNNKYIISKLDDTEISIENINLLLPTCIQFININEIQNCFKEKIYNNTYQLDISDSFADELCTQISEDE